MSALSGFKHQNNMGFDLSIEETLAILVCRGSGPNARQQKKHRYSITSSAVASSLGGTPPSLVGMLLTRRRSLP
jgi:hypothetical protein